MDIRVPEYFTHFRCLADKCRDSCCVGWDIYLDGESLRRYREDPAFDEILAGITEDGDGDPVFRRDSRGRCVNLDENGLCRIYAKHGHGALCEICREHPRYYNIYGAYAEGGLSVCCEEAARLILSDSGLPKEVRVGEVFTPSEDIDPQLLREAIEERRSLYSILFGGDAISEAMAKMLTRGGGNGSPSELTELLYEAMSVADSIELLSEEHRDMTDKGLLAVRKDPESFLRYLDTAHPDGTRRLVYYYLHRYFLDSALGLDGFGTYTRLSLSLSLITESAAFARGDHDLAGFIDIARELSKSLEYSTENVDILLEAVALD